MANSKSKFRAAVAKAKRLYKTGRYKSFADAVKAAYKKTGGPTKRRKVGATLLIERRETKKTRPKRIVRISRNSSGTFKGMQTVSGLKSALRRQLKTKIENAAGAKEMATTKRSRKKAQKRLSELKRQFKKLI